jgi:hypothetical protein
MHRLAWDLHYAPPKVASFSYPIAATPGNTARVPTGPWAPPGGYTVRLTAGGQTQTQPLRLRMDPRVKTPASALDQQFTLSMKLYQAINRLFDLGEPARPLHGQLLQLYSAVQGADVAPTSQAIAQSEALLKEADAIGAQ